MKIIERKINGVFEIQLDPHQDKRGFFMRTYDNEIFREHGLCQNWVQESHSLSVEKGVVRGMHFQFPPYAETKLIRVISGEIFDVFLDLRKGSSTFGQWDSIVLSSENKKEIYLPRGLAHGFCTLTEDCGVLYKMDNIFSPENSGIIKWNDQDIKIDWPIDEPILNERDSKAGSFKEFIETHIGLEV